MDTPEQQAADLTVTIHCHENGIQLDYRAVAAVSDVGDQQALATNGHGEVTFSVLSRSETTLTIAGYEPQTIDHSAVPVAIKFSPDAKVEPLQDIFSSGGITPLW